MPGLLHLKTKKALQAPMYLIKWMSLGVNQTRYS